ncbi:MAG: D-cysteine desulfhydrase family protein [Chloroflexi bacterium]|nr:D-cysteine desulfhydrase family protein [Chloroflexota bacterium]
MEVIQKLRPPLSLEQIRSTISRLPRVRLADLPTPLHYCPRLSQALGGPRIFIKRDDLTGLAFGGNKTRNLEFRMAEARELGADVIIAGLEAQSNAARQTTAAANVLGMRTILILRGDRGDWGWQGNLLIDKVLGAEVRLVQVSSWAEMDAVLRSVAEEQRRLGYIPYVMNHAKMFAVASALAYVLCTLEIEEQLQQMGAAVDHIYLSSSSKGQAGVVLAKEALKASFQVVGISPRNGTDRCAMTAMIANQAAEMLGWDLVISPADVVNYSDYVGPGYGLPTPGCLEAIRLMARSEGILLDPVYTGKAMAGLIDHIRQGRLRPSETVVFIHTGGTPALFAYKDWLLGP